MACAAVRRAGALVLRLRCGPLAQLLDGAGDRLLGKLAIEGEVGDDRRAAVKLDQHPGGTGLVHVRRIETERRRAVGVLLDLLVQLLGLGDERVGLLAQPQRSQIAVVQRVQVRAEGVLLGVAQRLADRPAGVVDELRPGDGARCDRRDDRLRDLRRDVGDREQRVDRADRDCAAADEPLADLRELEDLRPRGRELAAPAERLRRAVEGVALLEHRLDGIGLLQRRELLAGDVLRRAVGARALLIAHDNRRVGQVELAARGEAVIAGDELIAATDGSHDEGDEQPAQGDRLREAVDVRLVEPAHVLAQADVIQRQATLAGGGGTDGHAGLLGPLVETRPPIPVEPSAHVASGAPRVVAFATSDARAPPRRRCRTARGGAVDSRPARGAEQHGC